MSITDELRNWWVRKFPVMDKELHEDFTAIADRIDAEHEKAEQDLIDANNQMEQLCECSIRLPVDADGVPIHVGDTVYGCRSGMQMAVRRLSLTDRWAISTDTGLMPKSSAVTHVRPDSFERIADELDEMVDASDSADDRCEKLADLAARIRRLAAKEDER